MDNYEKNLFYQAVEMHDKANELLHRIVGYLDAKADLKPALFFVEGPTILQFPTKTTSDSGQLDAVNEGFVEFTDKEIKQMPKQIKNLILIDKKRCRYRKRKSGANTTTYQIRFRSAGYDVTAHGVTLQLAKENMLKKLRTAQPKSNLEPSSIPTTFHSFTVYYFQQFRKEKVCPRTYKIDFQRYEKYLRPVFNEKPIERITPSECKIILDEVQSTGKGKTAEELYSLLSIIFKGAIAHGIIEKNPLSIVLKPTYEKVNGIALTREEEKLLFKNLSEPDFVIATALALYCGLRPNELATAVIYGDFIKAVNSKRKNKRTEYKKIPICDKLKPYIANGIPPLPTPQLIRRRIKDALPNHKLYDLRTTFYTRCKELGVADVALKHFAGHALDKLESAYTDLSDEYLLKEGKKLNKW